MNDLLKIIVFLSVIICVTISSQVPRPRGVSLSRASLYNPEKDFRCFDNSKTIPFTQVNDDYCDCPDASDEPGTSACLNGIFYCRNAGYKPMNLASSRVNDGICDCCDGSDEYAKTNVKCPKTCDELGKKSREESQRLAELVKVGKQIREDMSQRGSQLKQQKHEKLSELQKNKEEAEKVQLEKEELKTKAEQEESKALEYYKQLEEEIKAKEDEERLKLAEIESQKDLEYAQASFKSMDSNEDGILDFSEIKTRQTFDTDKNGEVSEEEARYYLNNEDSVDFAKFYESAWANVKPALLKDSGMYAPPKIEGEGEHVDEETEEEADNVFDNEHDEEPADVEQPEEEEEEAEEETDPDGEIPVYKRYDENTKAIIEAADAARKEHSEADKAVISIDAEMKTINEYLEKDFGPDEEYAILEGQCFDFKDHEYIYKLCPFDRTTQAPESSGAEIRLGSWGKWNGPEDNKYSAMLYDRGQACWNGPQRTTHVNIVCGSDNKLVSVSEPNKCEYLMEFETPAACSELYSENESVHDEL